MSEDAVRTELHRATEELRLAHGLALGALQAELSRIDLEGRESRSALATDAARDVAIAKTRASNGVMAAHGRVRDLALDLATSADSNELRVAQVLDLGQILVNAKRAGVNSQLDVPLLVPLFGAGNVVVVGAGDEADSFVRNVQLEALQGTAPSQLRLAAFDPLLTNPLAPFAPLAEAGDDLIETVQTGKGLDVLIDGLTSAVARIGDILLGAPGGLIEHRAALGERVERYQLVSFHDYPTSVSEQQHRRLLTLARAAARHGIAFVFHVPEPAAAPAWLDLAELRSLGDSFDISASRAIWSRDRNLNAALPNVRAADISPAVSKIVEVAKAEADAAAEAAERASQVSLEELLPTQEWELSSADGLIARLAKAPSGPIEVTFGDDMPHGLITGGTGSGKSNLIKLLIYSLAARYSPDELELYLVDMKEGATLAPLAPSVDGAYLPHVRVMGLQADQEFGLSVLHEVERLFKQRMSKMAPYDNIDAYRENNPDARMPRILVLIDEFQLLLADDPNRIGRASASKLLALVKLVRAGGIHIVVATQEISTVTALAGARDGLLGNTKLRVALSNTARASEETLESGNTAAASLRGKGSVVINANKGTLDDNQIGRTPKADEVRLGELRAQWFNRRPNDLPDIIVFNGKPPANLLPDVPAITSSRSAVARGLPARAFIGRPVAVTNTPVSFAFDPVPARNIAVVGGASGGLDDDMELQGDPQHLALGVIGSCALSLAVQYDPGQVQFVVLDLLSNLDRQRGQVQSWISQLDAMGHEIRVVSHADVKPWIAETHATLSDRGAESRPMYVFGLGFERVAPLMEREGGIGTVAPIKLLQAIFQQGPTTHLHSIFWWAQGQIYLTHIEKKMESYFTGTLVLFGAEEVAQRVNDLTTKWEGADNRGLFRDSSGAQGKQKVIPYRPLTSDETAAFVGLIDA